MAESNSLALLYAEARAHGGVIDLSGRAKWHLTGADRVRYLNGQVTNDIRRAAGDSAMVACVTTAKGRLCGVVYVSAAADFLRVDAEGELREALTARLERYIIADDVTLEDVTEEECLFHVLPAGGSEAPIVAGAEVRGANRFGRAGFDVIAPQAEHGRVMESLSAGHALLPGEITEVLRIEAGVPRWGAELTEETLPAEAGLDGTAIDFHKGCYIGQEVISRIKSVGHVNRQLTGLAADAPLAPGMTLHDAAGTAVGEITSAGWSFGLESWAGLGYLKRGFAGAALDARSPDGGSVAVRAVQVKGLPMAP